VAAVYGYGRITTPGFEDTELFVRTSGEASDIVRKEMYTFVDRGGRSLTLRPEGTAPVARAYLEHGLHRGPQPFKAYMIAPMYRYERPQRGRYREHWQFSLEAIGSSDPAIDAEVVQLYDDFLGRLGVTGYWIELNSIGDRACRPAYVERLQAWLSDHEALLDDDAEAKRRTSPLRIFDTKNESLRGALADAPKIGESLCAECEEHFRAVRSYLGQAQGQLVGGGRYDYLVEQIGGPATPGIGFGAGIERLELQLQEQGVVAEPRPLDVFFLCEDEDDRRHTLPVLAELRRRGVSAEMDYAGRSGKGQATHAGRLGAKRTVVVNGETAEVRERGRPDRTVPTSELVEALA
jgi:histidyl-tRNA synthetase